MTREWSADESDIATEQEELARELTIAAIRSRAEELSPIGSCYNCSEPVAEGRKYCDKYCAEDHHRRVSRSCAP